MTAVQTTTDQYPMSEAEAVEKGEGTCSTCTWWKPPKSGKVGMCGLRFPPMFGAGKHIERETRGSDWCDFHKPQDAESE